MKKYRIRRSSYLESESFLVHYGITGMKAGVRRFQNEDGSLTEEGRRRYGIGPGRSSGSSALTMNKLRWDSGQTKTEEKTDSDQSKSSSSKDKIKDSVPTITNSKSSKKKKKRR